MLYCSIFGHLSCLISKSGAFDPDIIICNYSEPPPITIPISLFHQLLDGFAELIHGAFFSLPDILHNAGFDVAGKQYLVEAV